MASSSSSKMTMKLLIDTKNQKVLFAEASKPVIDFLFNLLCLPIGTVVRLLNKNGMVGCLGNLYHSVENLNDNYMQPNLNKDVLLKPKSLISSSQITALLPASVDDSASDDDGGASPTLGSSFFMCSRKNTIGCTQNVTCDNTTRCSCGGIMNRKVNYVGKKVAADDDQGTFLKSGFVKEIVTFMVMDDLVVEPMSTISSITLLNKFNVKDVGSLQEKVVKLGMAEGIKLLKASLCSKMVLTSVFLVKKNTKAENTKKIKRTRRLRRRNILLNCVLVSSSFVLIFMLLLMNIFNELTSLLWILC